jgi:FKBP-type peptidyl-prolyl cis-trans isomerase
MAQAKKGDTVKVHYTGKLTTIPQKKAGTAPLNSPSARVT